MSPSSGQSNKSKLLGELVALYGEGAAWAIVLVSQ